MTNERCKCFRPPRSYFDFTIYSVGTDETNGRFGEVTIEKCKKCSTLWLCYSVEYEAFSRSGRWYRGVITSEETLKITPENSVDYLKSLDWYLYGGSYFDSSGKRGSGNVFVDL